MVKTVWLENGKVLSAWERSNLFEKIRRTSLKALKHKPDSKRRLAALKAWETMRRRRAGK